MKLYQIKNLTCSYKKSGAVLKISDLTIEEGKVYFIIGSSGAGKSTLLETLGLMNDPFSLKDNGESTKFSIYNRKEGQYINVMQDLWIKGDKRKSTYTLAEFRNRYLSFIFQSPNFFTNLSALENVMITQIIQGANLDEASSNSKPGIYELLEEDVAKDIVENKRPPNNLSGGQKQRLAFLRALNGNYDILLADEPTGNLDFKKSEQLIDLLVSTIKNKNRTAIIVTHSIDLAIQYADEIIVIKQDPEIKGSKEHTAGLIDKESIFSRKEGSEIWMHTHGNITSKPDLSKKLKEYFPAPRNANEDAIEPVEYQTGLPKLLPYTRTFLVPESRTIRKKWYILALLFIISCASLWLIGFSQGASDYLDKKMNGPFVTMLNVNIPGSSQYDIRKDFPPFFSDKSADEFYGLESFHFKQYTRVHFKAINKPYEYAEGQVTMTENNEPMFRYLFQSADIDIRLTPKPILMKEADNASREVGSSLSVIVTEGFLNDLGYGSENKWPAFLQLKHTINGKDFYIPLPIEGVVSQLPNGSDVFVPEDIYNAIRKLYGNGKKLPEHDPFNPNIQAYQTRAIVFVPPPGTPSGSYPVEYFKNLEKRIIHPDFDVNITRKRDEATFRKGAFYFLSFRDSLQKVEYMNYLAQALDSVPHVIMDDYKYHIGQMRETVKDEMRVQYISLGFKPSALDKIDTVATLIEEKFTLKPELKDIENMKLFGIFKKTSSWLSWFLKIMASALISYGLISIFIQHINQNKKNIGTLKAFGISNIRITLSYLSIAITFILLLFFLSHGLVYGFGECATHFFFHNEIRIDWKNNNLFHYSWFDMEIMVWYLITPIVILFFVIFGSLYSKTPGDLIFNR